MGSSGKCTLSPSKDGILKWRNLKLVIWYLAVEEDRSSGHRILNIKECEHVRIKISLEANAKVLNCFVLHPTTSYKIEQTRNTYWSRLIVLIVQRSPHAQLCFCSQFSPQTGWRSICYLSELVTKQFIWSKINIGPLICWRAVTTQPHTRRSCNGWS